jgi:putative ABC transport system ATP-binding protein
MWIVLEAIRAGRRVEQPELPLLRDVSLAVARGEYVAVLGPSGAGKSLLLDVLGGLVRPEGGRYWLEGRRVDGLGEEARDRLRGRRIGFLVGAPRLVPELSVVENVELPLVYRRVAGRERRARAVAILGDLGMGPRLRLRPSELSPGERQRVALARACVGAPDLLLADEPTRGLDGRSGDEIMDLLESRCALGATLVIATQDPARGRRARRLVQMRDGAVVRELAGGLRFGSRGAPARPLRGRARRR